MSNELQKQPITTNALFSQANVQQRFEELLGDKAAGFIASVLQTVNNNKLLKSASPTTIMNAAATAAAMDLPINQNLGFAWIVPYKGNAQFQMGWKGFVQLALRTNQYRTINVVEIYVNQFHSFNVMTEELDCDFSIEGKGHVVGYAGYLKLMNGFEKTVYWSEKKVIEHAKKYSKTYGKKNQSGKLIHSPWNDEGQFGAMAKKTVLKNMISKWGIMSIEMQEADKVDQAVIKEEGEVEYVDNVIVVEKKKESMKENNNEKPELP
jgi:recombination protein RecT